MSNRHRHHHVSEATFEEISKLTELGMVGLMEFLPRLIAPKEAGKEHFKLPPAIREAIRDVRDTYLLVRLEQEKTVPSYARGVTRESSSGKKFTPEDMKDPEQRLNEAFEEHPEVVEALLVGIKKTVDSAISFKLGQRAAGLHSH